MQFDIEILFCRLGGYRVLVDSQKKPPHIVNCFRLSLEILLLIGGVPIFIKGLSSW